MLHRLLLCAPALLAGCLAWPLSPVAPVAPDPVQRITALLPTDLLLLGERHDAPDHQRLQHQVVQTLAARGQLAALALEMAEHGASTHGLPRNASETQVRAALRWQDRAWPWPQYGPVVMAAVQAGLPVLGANLPRQALRAAQDDASLDQRLAPSALARQQVVIRDGHCGQLPPARVPAMARMQIARDVAMAQALVQAHHTFAQAGQTVLLIAGGWHVRRGLGVPVHVPSGLTVKVILAVTQTHADPEPEEGLSAQDVRWRTPALAEPDYCAGLRVAPMVVVGRLSCPHL